jgi:hypothetical protein
MEEELNRKDTAFAGATCDKIKATEHVCHGRTDIDTTTATKDWRQILESIVTVDRVGREWEGLWWRRPLLCNFAPAWRIPVDGQFAHISWVKEELADPDVAFRQVQRSRTATLVQIGCIAKRLR